MCRLAPMLLLCACTIEIRVPREPAQDAASHDSDPHQAAACNPCDPPCASHQTCVNGTCYDKAAS
jgi:hypothetical protein